MGRILVILAFLLPAIGTAQRKSLTVDDLLNVSSLSPQRFDDFIVKKGFAKRRSVFENSMGFTFFENKATGGADTTAIDRSIDLYKKSDTWCIAFHTSSKDEYVDGLNRLKKMNFLSNAGNDTTSVAPLLFQRKAITIETRDTVEDESPVYSFILKKKEIPDASSVQFAEDLLKFDSHEYLVSCFGEKNVKKDIYLFSEESRKCSILYPNTDKQAVFIWDDQNNYRKISYVLITGTLSTPDGKQYNGSFSHNKWELKNGVYQGMRIGDLLRLNSNDFKFYGNQSEFSMMVEPRVTGSINFKWIGIGFNCFNCDRAAILDKQKVSASDAVDNNLAMHVSCIMLTP